MGRKAYPSDVSDEEWAFVAPYGLIALILYNAEHALGVGWSLIWVQTKAAKKRQSPGTKNLIIECTDANGESWGCLTAKAYRKSF